MPARPPAMDEKALQRGVIDVAHVFGWKVAHFRSVPVKRGSSVVWETPVQADGAGFPDLVLVRDRVLWVELKVGGNALTEKQAEWARALDAAGAERYVWTEHDWNDGVVDAVLRRAA
jgi:VRR-NUC domain